MNLTKEQIATLDSIKSSVRCGSISRPVFKNDGTVKMRENRKTGNDEIVYENVVIAEVMDNVRLAFGETVIYAVGYGPDENAAVAEALINAAGHGPPKTPAETLVENRELRARLAAIEVGENPEVTLPVKEDSEPDTNPVPDKNLSAADLITSLKSRGIALPDGDRRSKAWRDEAEALLNVGT